MEWINAYAEWRLIVELIGAGIALLLVLVIGVMLAAGALHTWRLRRQYRNRDPAWKARRGL
jgi:hypothetical protein